MKSIEEQLKIIKRGVVELIPEEELIAKLKEGRPLRVKWGADPSAPDIHLGHSVVLNKLRQFQDLGHKVIFIIGDFTARIGDPSGKSETRKPLTPQEVKKNAETYQEQVFKILDKKATEVVYNHNWLSKLNMEDIFNLAAKYTVARMLERDDFMNRFEKERPISIHEFLYPLVQGYDSVEVKADIEVGGTDQKFNMLVGRELQRDYKDKTQVVITMPQVILTMPLLEGTDGVQKMSKSLNNYIGITESPAQIFGKTMSISDDLMMRYYELLTNENLEAIKQLHPKEAKMKLASILITKFYNAKEAQKAAEGFDAIFKQGGTPEDIETAVVAKKELNIIDLLSETKLASSKTDAKRLVGQGGVSVDGEVIKDEKQTVSLDRERLIKVGKRRFLKVKNA
ncbi:MAG: tyrosine--tRNA ligase [Candidatus Margulisbacteria bacterium]|nr:tyrosine--tRNA ligase [Candidatus Margulisiibacteriota bacterium]